MVMSCEDHSWIAGGKFVPSVKSRYRPGLNTQQVARELIAFELAEGPEPGPGMGPEDGMAFRVQVWD